MPALTEAGKIMRNWNKGRESRSYETLHKNQENGEITQKSTRDSNRIAVHLNKREKDITINMSK